VGIEVKAPKGKQSEHQRELQKKLEAAGGKYILAYSLDELIAQACIFLRSLVRKNERVFLDF
jgi:hypothetical protein